MGIATDRLATKRRAVYRKPGQSNDTIKVKGYARADGTKVPDYERAAPPPGEETSPLQNMLLRAAETFGRRKPAPTTAQGYADMFASLDPEEWGGADIGISYQMKDGRRVWLYGDTISAGNGFVHSTAIVQDGGSLHVSKGGKQLLPNGGRDPADPTRQRIYWIDGVRQGPTKDTLRVSAMQMSIGKGGPWDFKQLRQGKSREAIVKVSANGDLTFQKWSKWHDTPTKNNPHLTDDFNTVGPNHYTYGTVTHDIVLANGHHLTTTSQNWDDPYENHVGPNGFRWHDFHPIFGQD